MPFLESSAGAFDATFTASFLVFLRVFTTRSMTKPFGVGPRRVKKSFGTMGGWVSMLMMPFLVSSAGAFDV
eukprot:15090705-Heterocapsa_arctica.AAC.1